MESSFRQGILTDMACYRLWWSRLLLYPCLIPGKANLRQVSSLAALPQSDCLVFGNHKIKLHQLYRRNDSQHLICRPCFPPSPGARKVDVLPQGHSFARHFKELSLVTNCPMHWRFPVSSVVMNNMVKTYFHCVRQRSSLWPVGDFRWKL